MSRFGGYLTIASNRYNIGGDLQSATLRLSPECGATLPIVNSLGAVVDVPFLTGPTDGGPTYSVAPLTPGTIHDLWTYAPAGVAIPGLAAWSTGKAYGAGTYGAGIYGNYPEPPLIDAQYWGIPTNPAPITLRLNDGSFVTVPACQATYIGAVRVSEDAAVLRWHDGYGEAREKGIWNRHNQKKLLLKGGDTTMQDPAKVFAYSPTWAPVFGNLNAHLKVFSGRPCLVDLKYCHNTWLQEFAGYSSIVQGAIGWNSQDTPSGFWFQRDWEGYTGPGGLMGAVSMVAHYNNAYLFGLRKAYGIIKTQGVTATSRTNDGTSVMVMGPIELRMLVTAEWDG